MKFRKQSHNIYIKNFDIIEKDHNANKRHGQLLPENIRCIICGPSNCGKTNIMLSLLTEPNGLKFANVYIYSKSLHQPKYLYLKQCLFRVKGMGYFAYADNEEIIKPQNVKPYSVFIFDDVSSSKQDTIRDYFSMGRHNLVDCFYLTQTYTSVPKHLIRDNVNLIILFKQDDLNLRHIYDDHVNTDMSFSKFKDLCATCWTNKYGFVVINKDCHITSGRYRNGFDKFLVQ